MQVERLIKAHVTSEVSTARANISGHLTTGIKDVTDKITHYTRRLDGETVMRRRREKLLESLKFPGMNERWNHVTESYERTFEWIFDSDGESYAGVRSDIGTPQTELRQLLDAYKYKTWDNFHDWLKSESNIYWINGKPGSGKSTLVKFIVSSPLTQAALDIWRAGAIILFHFLWKPGSRMQNSVKGFLCSILHRALSRSSEALDSALGKFDKLAFKSSDTDWSTKELTCICLDVLASYPSPLCIFLDGLDEVCAEDGVAALLQLVDDLRTIPHLKICLASRPEHRLRIRLCKYQQLRVHDLTARDMKLYVQGVLAPSYEAYDVSSATQQKVTKGLLGKAEGVFLWLHLALRSLIEGLENGDGENELIQRLESLPNEILALYQDMWKRLNDDTTIYRQTAAQYFNLVISSTVAHDKIDEITQDPGVYSPYRDYGTLSVFQLMVATDTAVQSAVLQMHIIPNEEYLAQLCQDLQHKVHVRCAGLLEIPSSTSDSKPSQHNDLSSFDSPVRFIHRTAYDFLVDTEEGQSIRAFELSSQDEQYISLVKGFLVEARVNNSRNYRQVRAGLLPLSWVSSKRFKMQVHELLQIFWDWYDLRRLQMDNRSPLYPSPHFLAIAVFPNFKTFVLENIARSPDPALLATRILRDMFCDNFFCIGDCRAFLELLLSLGANPNTEGICYADHPGQMTRSKSKQFISAFGQFLKTSIISARWNSTPPSELLSTFMNSNVRLDARVAIRICCDKTGPYKIATVLSFKPGDWNNLRADPGNHECFTVILDANLAFLVDVLRKLISGGSTTGLLNTPRKCLAPLGEVESRTQPSTRIPFIIITDDICMRIYRIHDEKISGKLLAMVEPLIYGGFINLISTQFIELREKIIREIADKSEKYEELHDSVTSLLEKEGCGY